MSQPKRYRNFTFTHNNYQNTDIEDSIECKYIAYSHEVGESGTPHLQGYVCFTNAKSHSAVIALLPGCHIENMKGTIDQNGAYISKSGADVIERGVRPMTNDDKGMAEITRWNTIRDQARANKVHEIESKVQITHYHALKSIARDQAVPVANLNDVCGLFIYGPPGTGKTRAVVDMFPVHYEKLHEKWWDYYNGEDVVFLDEFDGIDAKSIGKYLKQWGDFKKFRAETKGGSMVIRPKMFIICSNYSLEELFPEKVLYEAIRRRFKVVYKTSIEQNIF